MCTGRRERVVVGTEVRVPKERKPRFCLVDSFPESSRTESLSGGLYRWGRWQPQTGFCCLELGVVLHLTASQTHPISAFRLLDCETNLTFTFTTYLKAKRINLETLLRKRSDCSVSTVLLQFICKQNNIGRISKSLYGISGTHGFVLVPLLSG